MLRGAELVLLRARLRSQNTYSFHKLLFCFVFYLKRRELGERERQKQTQFFFLEENNPPFSHSFLRINSVKHELTVKNDPAQNNQVTASESQREQ